MHDSCRGDTAATSAFYTDTFVETLGWLVLDLAAHALSDPSLQPLETAQPSSSSGLAASDRPGTIADAPAAEAVADPLAAQPAVDSAADPSDSAEVGLRSAPTMPDIAREVAQSQPQQAQALSEHGSDDDLDEAAAMQHGERTHLPYSSACRVCVASKGRATPHRRLQSSHAEGEMPLVEIDFGFVSTGTDAKLPVLAGVSMKTGHGLAVLLRKSV